MAERIDVQTKTLSGRIILVLAGILLAALAFWVVASSTVVASWSLVSWETLETRSDGTLLRTVHEPLALFRNIALILFAMAGLALSLRQYMGGRPGVARSMTSAEEIEPFRRQFADELQTILKLFQSHAKENRAFSAALNSGRDNLAASRGDEQIHAAIQFLVSASQQMLRANEDYEKKLRDAERQVEALRVALDELRELVSRDSLTNVFSRRHFDETLPQQLRKSANSNKSISLIMADIDHFKEVNDKFGHPIGDEVLRKFADLLIANTKGSDSVARYGGEEFVIILPETPGVAAASLADQIRKKLEAKKWVVKGGSSIGTVTASFGVAEFDFEESADDLVLRADAKLYASKAAGRNKVSA